MLTSLFTGVSGLNANMTSLSVIGNNIANINTTGFKTRRASFEDILSQSLNGVSGSSQIGLGVRLDSIMPLFTQGAFETTGNAMDLAIDGNGFYVMRDADGALYYSRAGQFHINKDDYIINPDGYILRGYKADSSGNLSTTVDDLKISSSAIDPNSTSKVSMVANMQSDADVKGFVFTTGSNEDIRFSPDGGTNYYTADMISSGGLLSGSAYTGAQSAEAIKTAMESADPGSNTYTVTYDKASGKFKVANDSGNGTLVLDWSSSLATANSILGFNAASSGNISAGSSDSSDNTAGEFNVNKASDTSNFSSAVTVYDSLGNSHQINVYFRKSDTGSSQNTWEWYGVTGSSDSSSGSDEIQAKGSIVFDTAGHLKSESTITYPTGGFDFSGGASQDQSISFDFGKNIAEGGTGSDGVTQYGQPFALFDQSQDGYASGSLRSISVDSSGIITGQYTNGRTMNVGQVVLSQFKNPNSLISEGKNLFVESNDSGEALIGEPNSSGRGSIHSNALELSNVDIAEEFVKMIAAQRGFQANSKIITTTDEILNELVNIKR